MLTAAGIPAGSGTPVEVVVDGTITPNGVRAAAETCDGFFPVWMDPEQYSVFADPIDAGFAKAKEQKMPVFLLFQEVPG